MKYLVDKIFSLKREKQIFNKDVLFVWIPKTAGNSVVDYFSSYNFERNANVNKLKKGFFFTKGFNTFGHIDVKSLVREKIISDTYIQNVYKFSIVRNPYDRLVSLYEYHKKINFFEGTFESYLMKIMEIQEIYFVLLQRMWVTMWLCTVIRYSLKSLLDPSIRDQPFIYDRDFIY